jgi:ABC-2 type transport system ATP-binding protein
MSTTQNILSTTEVPVIAAEGLRKTFGETVAVDGLDFSVAAGSVLGLLGPNGAGKTTTIKLLTTLLPMEAGSASVAGFDVATQPAMVRRSIGLAGQSAAVDEKLTARQNLDLFGRLYHLAGDVRKARVSELIERFDMSAYANRAVETLSGGERRRLDVVAALIAKPPAIFLDEPTAGLDPRGRLALWDQIRAIRDDGAAVVLTTQYLEEADQLADSIVVIDHGKAVAAGTTSELKSRLERDVLEVTVDDPAQLANAAAAMGSDDVATVNERTLHLAVSTTGDSLAALRRVEESGVAVADFQLRRPTLDDVFIDITGEPSRSATTEPEEVTA